MSCVLFEFAVVLSIMYRYRLGLVLFSALSSTTALQPTKLLFSVLWSPDSTLERLGKVRFRVIGEGIHVLPVLGFPPLPPTWDYQHPPTLPTQPLQPMNSLPIGPRTFPTPTSLMLSRQTFWLKIITFLAESYRDELIRVISAENNTSHQFGIIFKYKM